MIQRPFGSDESAELHGHRAADISSSTARWRIRRVAGQAPVRRRRTASSSSASCPIPSRRCSERPNTRTLFRDTTTFNTYFTAADYGAVSGACEANKVDNIYSELTGGGAE